MKTLMTAFGPFPGVKVNPSRLLMERFASSLDGPRSRWEFDVLDVSWEGVRTWARRTDYERFRAVVHLGVAGGSPALRLERFARNVAAPKTPDNHGETWGRSFIRSHGVTRIETRFDLARARKRLGSSAKHVVVSESAGDYLCNFLYYLSAAKVRRHELATRVLFVHIPAVKGKASLPLEKQLPVLKRVVRALGL
jgi:pyroglutamyl-peptidase